MIKIAAITAGFVAASAAAVLSLGYGVLMVLNDDPQDGMDP